ncbi:MAG: uroporphyrinogen decarboxylase family protein [Terriglobales bacterium]
MPEHSTPRAILKGLLRGEPPPRPLLMPIIFSLGARLENLPLREFQSNPTKISNALRQIRSVLKVDGVTCYFDPFLEAEALGCKREWLPDGSCRLVPPSFSEIDDLHQQLNSPDSLTDKGRMPVACQVIQRLKVMLKDEPVLMSCMNGPFTLAAQLLGKDGAGSATEPPRDLIEFAAEVTAAVSRSFLEAGADAIFLIERFLPEFSSGTCRWYSSLLAPIANVIRFYEALPVLLLGSEALAGKNQTVIADCDWEFVLCPSVVDPKKVWLPARSLGCGWALPHQTFHCNQLNSGYLGNICSSDRRWLLTSSGDLPATTDIAQLSDGLGSFRQLFLAQQPLSHPGS